jgi:hypothetical protein
LLGRLASAPAAKVLVDLGELFDLPFVLLHLVLLPPDEPAASGEEQDDRGDQPAAVRLEEVAQLIAAQVLVDLAYEGFGNVRGLRQEFLNPLGRGSTCRKLPFPTRDEWKLAALRLAADAAKAKGGC